MANYKKVHITLTPEIFAAARKFAFENQTSISKVIDALIVTLIEVSLIEPTETPLSNG